MKFQRLSLRVKLEYLVFGKYFGNTSVVNFLRSRIMNILPSGCHLIESEFSGSETIFINFWGNIVASVLIANLPAISVCFVLIFFSFSVFLFFCASVFISIWCSERKKKIVRKMLCLEVLCPWGIIRITRTRKEMLLQQVSTGCI